MFFTTFTLLYSTDAEGMIKTGQFGNHGNSAVKRFLASEFEHLQSFIGMYSLVRGLNTGNLTPAWSRFEARKIDSRTLADTLSVLVDISDEIWDDFGSAWINQNHTMHSYDGEGRRVQTQAQMWLMNAWQNIFLIVYQYDGIGTLRKVTSRSWTGAAWVDNTHDTITYDAYGHVIEELIRVFNGSSWSDQQRIRYTYDGDGRPVELIIESWTGSIWQNVENYVVSYTGGGQLAELVYRIWGGADWVNSLRDSFTYDGSGHLIGELNQYWSAGAWNDDTRYTSTYDTDGFLVDVIEQRWSSSAWENASKQSFNNDMDGRATEILVKYWDGFDWANDSISYRTYDGPNLVEDYRQRWEGLSWVDVYKASYSWQTIITPDQTTQKYPVDANWNLVSVPLGVDDYSKAVLYPTASSNAFYFDAGYASAAVLENGRGYWLKFDSGQNVSMTGTMRTTDTIDVPAGWNLLGSLGVSIAAAGVGSIPGGLVTSNFFGFDAGYKASATIEPGEAYWVKVAEAGKLIFAGSGNVPAAARVKMELADERPPAPPGEAAAGESLPRQDMLGQNFPNPFNPVTEISYTLSEAGHVRLSVFNVIGHEVGVLVDGVREAGPQSVAFDARAYPSGVYFYKLSTPAFSGMRRMVLLK